MTGSKLYQEAMAFYESREGQDPDLQHKVWDGTPWIVEAYIGDINDRRERDMLEWCRARFGDASHPFGNTPRSGQWRTGNAIIHGWAWFGFATEEQMNQFIEAWPTPEGVER